MDESKPDAYCRDCHHMTYIVHGHMCAWCKSQNVGVQPALCKKTRAMGPIRDDDPEPTKHQRLKEGFALLNAAY